MSLAELAARPGPGHKQCTVCWLLTVVDGKPREDLLKALANPAVRYKEIAHDVRDELGHEIHGDTYSRHARGDCGATPSRVRP